MRMTHYNPATDRRAYGATNAGKRSVKTRRGQAGLEQRNLRTVRRIWIVQVPQDTVFNVKRQRLRISADRIRDQRFGVW
jgi:hypothetical protein